MAEQISDRYRQSQQLKVNTNGSIDMGFQPYLVRIDEIGNITYLGEAEPGSAIGSAFWRIRKITNDETIEFADGNIEFDNIWSDRLIYSYS